MTIRLATFPKVLFATICLPLAMLGLAGPVGADDEGLAGPSVDLGDIGVRFLPGALAERDRNSSAQRSGGLSTAGDVSLGGWNETCVAVNPRNSRNIASASLFELRVSMNGGASWMPAVFPKVPAGFVAQGDPSIAFDADGRLFFHYIGSPLGQYSQFLGIDVFVAECDPTTGAILPGYPINVSEQLGLPAALGASHDKGWLTIDINPSSPYANRLQLIWTHFVTPLTTGTRVLTTHSSDHGLTWSPVVQLGGSGTNFKWPVHIATAPNGDVYASFHSQPLFTGGAPNGTTGAVFVYRSVDGGETYPQVSQPFAAGMADMTFNVQTATGRIPGARFLIQGGVQPWVLPDPNVAGRISVVAGDDPDNSVSTGDAANVYIARSDNYGLNWSTPQRVDSGPGESFQVLPAAAVDPQTGAVTVLYYDNRSGLRNARGSYLLDVYAAVSLDGGATFQPDQRINDLPFDPEAGARCRYGCGPIIAQPWTGTEGKALAVATSGHILSYDGSNWTAPFFTPGPKFGIWGASETDWFACGAAGEILHYDGVNLARQSPTTTQSLFDMDGRTDSDVFAVGGGGTVLHYDGVSWSPLYTGTTEDLHDVWVNQSGSSVFAVGAHGTALRYDGVSWTSLPVGTQDNLFGVWGSGDSDVYATAAPGQLFHWDGNSWTQIATDTHVSSGVWGSSPSDVLMLGFGRLRRFNGVSWQPEDISEDLLWKVHGSGGSNVYVTGENGAIAHYDGSVWMPQSNPLTPTAPTLRIGEYIGVAAARGRAYAVWCGNSPGPLYLSQQAIFDAFDTAPSPPPLAAQVDIDPDVINLGSRAPWFAVYIESQEFDPSAIDLSTIRLAETVSPIRKFTVLGDHDGDQIPDLMVRFGRDEVDPLLVIGANSLEVTGSLVTGQDFVGSGDVRVIDPQESHLSATVVPNPVNPSAVLRFRTTTEATVTARIFDVEGRLVRTLSPSQPLEAGPHDVPFDGRDEHGRTLSTGIYFYRIEAGGKTASGRFAVLK